MKKAVIIIFLSSLIFISCEKDYSGIVDPSINEYQVISVSPSGNVLFNAIDSLITIKINFTQSSLVGEVSCDIYSSDNNRLNSSRIILYDNGNPDFGDDSLNDNKYANKFPLSSTYPIGNYSIRYYTTIITGDLKYIALSNFVYDNGQDNVAPVISNLLMPQSVNAGQTITFSVGVIDENGLNDLVSVFYEAYNPDGIKIVNSQGISQFPMFDDGNTQGNGDLVANDGTYTVTLTFPSDVKKGTWRFEFQARDRGGLLSNKIVHNILVQ
ncbi:MAG: PKD domain-containing protein [Ignavibacteriaceae bacterium]|nr:PKD domain-containing protein [Ignavibacteriaceae bacterium]